MSAVLRDWGSCGRVVLVDDQPVGYALYAPPAYFAGSGALPDRRRSRTTRSCSRRCTSTPRHAAAGFGRMLVQGMARDLIERGGIHAVEAFGDTRGPGVAGARRCLTPVDFLTQRGLQDPARPRDHPADADGPAERAVVARRGRGRPRAAARGGQARAEDTRRPPASDERSRLEPR